MCVFFPKEAENIAVDEIIQWEEKGAYKGNLRNSNVSGSGRRDKETDKGMTRENGEEPRRLADMEAQGRERFKKKECSVVSNAIEKLKKKKSTEK